MVIFLNIFVRGRQFGRLPKGPGLDRIKKSPNYRDGGFRNLNPTPMLATGKGAASRLSIMVHMLRQKPQRLRPSGKIPSVKTDLRGLAPEDDILVWFGHSSLFIQIGGKRILVDPVFSDAGSPVPFFNRSFRGANIYSAQDIPPVDYIITTHDHWDHLDYPTVMRLKHYAPKMICPLGVAEHFRRWGFPDADIMEMDWGEDTALADDIEIYCLPARHFSGRGTRSNRSLWASFLIKAGEFKIFIGGDGGYDTHFSEIGERFGGVNVAVLENGQYNTLWKYIHLLPEHTMQAALDLKASNVIPVHNSRFALARHSWDEPMRCISELHDGNDYNLLTPRIGQAVRLDGSAQEFTRWWEGID